MDLDRLDGEEVSFGDVLDHYRKLEMHRSALALRRSNFALAANDWNPPSVSIFSLCDWTSAVIGAVVTHTPRSIRVGRLARPGSAQ